MDEDRVDDDARAELSLLDLAGQDSDDEIGRAHV